jgi:hypothetical protein
MAKPTDFFVGITDLFSIILPGAALTFVALRAEEWAKKDVLGLLRLEGNERYVAFLVVAYLLGHVVDMIGASVIDNLYDLTYANWKRSYPVSFLRWLLETPGRILVELKHWLRAGISSRERKIERLDDDLFRAAKDRAGNERPEGINVYKWSRTWVMIKSASASSEIDRLQASSKFFRSMVTVFGIAWFCALKLGGPFSRRVGWACLVLSCASFLRYSDLRWKAVQQTYGFFVALRSMKNESASSGGLESGQNENESEGDDEEVAEA